MSPLRDCQIRGADREPLCVRQLQQAPCRDCDAPGARRLESHVCQWETSRRRQWDAFQCWYRCYLRWSDGTRCHSATVDPSDVRRTEWLVVPPAGEDTTDG